MSTHGIGSAVALKSSDVMMKGMKEMSDGKLVEEMPKVRSSREVD